MRRGDGLEDEVIFGGFEQSLNASLVGLRRWLGSDTRLLLRSCHSGQQAEVDPHGQSAALRRMDSIIRATAAAQCVPLLDVWALDADAGYYIGKGKHLDFHVPMVGSMQAAVAALLALVDMPASGAAPLACSR